MKVVFLGCTKYSEKLLREIKKINNIELKAVFTIPEYFNISYSKEPVKNTNYSDLSALASKWGIANYEVNSKEGQKITDYKSIIKEIQPDVILVLGWYYMVPKTIRDLAKNGAWGIHASLLPNYAGGAPLVWAMIEGERETGVSLFRLSDGVDDGDIIEQRVISIEYNDTIKEVYQKATNSSIGILKQVLGKNEEIKFIEQDKSKIEVYPQRSPRDGEIDLNWTSDKIFNFIRAQSDPYPGAFIRNSKGDKIILEKVRIEE
jgi:methionyl-tRNA formyltransferase